MNEQEKKPSNPSAFPEPYANDPNSAISHTKGMTLRDYFANSAMQGIISNEELRVKILMDNKDGREENSVNKDISVLSYSLADAMLKAREL